MRCIHGAAIKVKQGQVKNAARGDASISGHAGVHLDRPGVDTPSDIGNVLETARFQKGCYLHAAAAMVAQAGDGLVGIKFGHSWQKDPHGNRHQLKTIGFNVGDLALKGFSHIQHHGLPVTTHGFNPMGQLTGADLRDHALKLEARRLRKILQSRRVAIPHFDTLEIGLAGPGEQVGVHDGFMTDDGHQPPPHLQLTQQ